MNIFWREMKANRKSLIIWCIGVIFMVGGGIGKFIAYSTTGQSINELVAEMPKSVQTILGFGSFDLTKASGFYGMLFSYIVLMAVIHAVALGASIFSKEEIDKTSEFLFVKPVSRNKITSSKLCAGITNILIFNFITLVSSIGMFGKYSKGEAVTGTILKLMLGMFFLQLIFLFIGTAIAAIGKNAKAAASIATGVMLLTFILYKLVDLNTNLEKLKYLTPFKYFDAGNLINGKGFESVYVIISVLIITALMSMTYMFYKKRDLKV